MVPEGKQDDSARISGSVNLQVSALGFFNRFWDLSSSPEFPLLGEVLLFLAMEKNYEIETEKREREENTCSDF
jgi:hypothetical protein